MTIKNLFLLFFILNNLCVFGQPNVVISAKNGGLENLYHIDTLVLSNSDNFFNAEGKYLLKAYNGFDIVLSTHFGEVAVFNSNGIRLSTFPSSKVLKTGNETLTMGGGSINFTYSHNKLRLLQHVPQEIEIYDLEGNNSLSLHLNTLDNSNLYFLSYGHGLFLFHKGDNTAKGRYFISLENSLVFPSETTKQPLSGLVSIISESGEELSRVISPEVISSLTKNKASKSFKVDLYNDQFYVSMNGDPKVYLFDLDGNFLKKIEGAKSSIRNYNALKLMEDWLFGLRAFKDRVRYFNRIIKDKTQGSSVLDYCYSDGTSREIIFDKDVVFATNLDSREIAFLASNKGTFFIVKMKAK
ncbi:MAG: hypothetical protein WBB27_12440 [Maribacter sp.]